MTTRSKGPGAGFQWLSRGISVGFRHPRPLIGGAVMVTLLMLIPAVVTLAMEWRTLFGHAQPDPSVMFKAMPVSTLLNLLLVPIFAGYLQVIDAAENGEAARARDIFRPYRSSEALRLIGFALLMMVVFIVVFAIVALTVGRGLASWYIHLLDAQSTHQAMTMTLPGHAGAGMALIFVIGLYMFAAYAIALGQVALGGRNVLGAIGDGLLGALKNVLPLIVLVLCGILLLIVMAIAIFVVVLVVGLVGALAGKWFAVAVTVAIEIAMMFILYMIQFGTQYYMWRDVCGDDLATGTTEYVAA